MNWRCWLTLWMLPHRWVWNFEYVHTHCTWVQLCERCGKVKCYAEKAG